MLLADLPIALLPKHCREAVELAGEVIRTVKPAEGAHALDLRKNATVLYEETFKEAVFHGDYHRIVGQFEELKRRYIEHQRKKGSAEKKQIPILLRSPEATIEQLERGWGSNTVHVIEYNRDPSDTTCYASAIRFFIETDQSDPLSVVRFYCTELTDHRKFESFTDNIAGVFGSEWKSRVREHRHNRAVYQYDFSCLPEGASASPELPLTKESAIKGLRAYLNALLPGRSN